MAELRSAIREERRERRETVESWAKMVGAIITILTGLVGAVIGLLLSGRSEGPVQGFQPVVACLRGARTDAIETQFRDTRKFVEERLRDLGKSLNGEPRLARAAIARRVQKIEMTPDGKTYVASGSWDLLGGGAGAVSMVPGARIARRMRIALAFLWLLEGRWPESKLIVKEAHAFQQVGVWSPSAAIAVASACN